MKIFAFGSSIVSSYWNGAATYYRGCYKYLAQRGHEITFAEPDAYGRQQHRDAGDYTYVKSLVYRPTVDIEEMLERASEADVVVKHSGIGVDDVLLERLVAEMSEERPTFFWDVDSPATIARLRADVQDPFREAVPRYDAVLSYGGGPASRDGYLEFGARAYYNIYNGLDPDTHHPVPPDDSLRCDVAFLGNRLPDREARVEELFLRAAMLAPERDFLLGGEGWGDKPLPKNLRWIGHVPTGDHNRVNCSAGMVMNINRSSMASTGFSPPTRVFEVAGAGACMLCDDWPGIDDCFEPGKEILVIRGAEDVVDALRRYDDAARQRIGEAFHARALKDHTYAQRAAQAEAAFLKSMEKREIVTSEVVGRA
ncbi:glycosyltransferase [Edaphobacter sp. HDX4]|uniref:CgeB family protein n=1 Tax=Edaphobacter sp. HDX4 TaxID=2794064 RepID=UPI002FE58B13